MEQLLYLGRNASNEAVLEDVVEAVYRRLPEINPVLYNKIIAWEQRNQEKAVIFKAGNFSQVFVFNYLGIDSKIAENNTGTVALDADIVEALDLFYL